MAKIPNGILGAFLGKAGPVTGYIRNGQNILRSSNSRKDGIVTPGRTAQRQKMKVCTEFTRAFSGTGFFSKTFPAYGDTGSGYNRATSALLNLAIAGDYPDTHISYPDVLLSRGPLPAAENAAAAANAGSNLLFSWTDNSGRGTAKANDKVILIAYFPTLQQVIFSLQAADRADCQAILTTATLQGYVAETWIGLLDADEANAANSVYTGTLQL